MKQKRAGQKRRRPDRLEASDIQLEIRPPLYPKQRAAIFAPERYAVVEATVKAGKTVACLHWIAEQATKLGTPGRKFWWVAPIYKQTQIAFERLARRLPPNLFPRNITALTIGWPNGAVIEFKSAENPDALYGEDVWAAVIDEASRVRRESWYALRSTLTFTHGAVRIIGNVKGRRNWAYEMARRAEGGEPGMHYAKLTATDAVAAGVLDAQEIEDARRDLPEAVFNELYMAEPSDDGGNPFGLQHIAAACKGFSNLPTVAWGWDLAETIDWTVGVGLDDLGAVTRVERFRKPWTETRDTILALVGTLPALIDASGVGKPIVEQLQIGTFSAIAGRSNFQGRVMVGGGGVNSVQALYERLTVGIQQGVLTLPEDGPLIQELESFEYVYRHSASGHFTGVKYCLAPETRVLTRDLTWVGVGSLRAGDGLLAFDEHITDRRTRRWRDSVVTVSELVVLPCSRITLDDGTQVVASDEHLWLVDTSLPVGHQWRKTGDLNVGARLLRLLPVWDTLRSYAAGYLAAVFDGEGHLSQGVRRGRSDQHYLRVGFAQRDNELANEARQVLREAGFRWGEYRQRSGCISFGITGRLPEALRLLGSVRPKRLLGKFDAARLGGMYAIAAPSVVAIEPLGTRPVVALGTSTGTLVAEGLASHNSAPPGQHDDCVCALALAFTLWGEVHGQSLGAPVSMEQVSPWQI